MQDCGRDTRSNRFSGETPKQERPRPSSAIPPVLAAGWQTFRYRSVRRRLGNAELYNPFGRVVVAKQACFSLQDDWLACGRNPRQRPNGTLCKPFGLSLLPVLKNDRHEPQRSVCHEGFPLTTIRTKGREKIPVQARWTTGTADIVSAVPLSPLVVASSGRTRQTVYRTRGIPCQAECPSCRWTRPASRRSLSPGSRSRDLTIPGRLRWL